MLGLGARKRAREEAARKAWLARREAIDDPALCQRTIDCIERAIAAATPEQSDTEFVDGVKHTSVWWTWRLESDTGAQKMVHPEGNDFHLFIEEDADPDNGPWLLATSVPSPPGSVVLWMPGLGFDRPEQFLDWFEEVAR